MLACLEAPSSPTLFTLRFTQYETLQIPHSVSLRALIPIYPHPHRSFAHADTRPRQLPGPSSPRASKQAP